jgi:hypothetical protein
MKTFFTSAFSACLVASSIMGCATTGTDGVVEIGENLYMIGGLGNFSDFSSSAVKARMFQDATKSCSGKGKQVETVGSTGKDSSYGTYASAEVQFRCI